MKGKLFFVLSLLVITTLIGTTFNSRGAKAIEATYSAASTGTTVRVSVASDGTEGNNKSYWSSVSADGRYVTFHSAANNLVSGDTNQKWDVFVHDRLTGETSRVSVASDGTEGNSYSGGGSISADGRYVAFASLANNLVSGDTNGYLDVFVHDRVTGETSRVSVASDGTAGNNDSNSYMYSISADGRYVAFYSWASNLVSGDTNQKWDVFVHDRLTGETSRVSVASDGTAGNNGSYSPSISADGRYVAFTSMATNLVSGDTNSSEDVFVHDRVTGETSRVSVASDGTEGNYSSDSPSISEDGRYTTFDSWASNLVSGDTNGTCDTFVHDRVTGETSRVSVASDGTEGNNESHLSSISADGRYVAFYSLASNLVGGDTNGYSDVFVHNREGVNYSISGRVTDGTSGISGVTISIGPSGSTTTDDNGYYTITNLVSGTYSLTASKSGYTFAPTSRSVIVPPSKSSQDFVGAPIQQGCSVPFLSQRDERWANYPLRTNGICSLSCDTIGKCGCTLTAANMIFDYYGADLLPPSLSDCMGTNACPFSWTTGATCSNGKASWVNKWPFSWEKLNQEVGQNKHPVILGMHRKTDPNQTHWVAVISGQGNSPSGYTIHDPWFLGGANMTLTLRAKDYDFDWIALYSGQPNCTVSLAMDISQQKEPNIASPVVPTTTITGNVWIYSATDISMTLLLVAESSVANITEMQIWTDTIPTSWQPFATLITVPVSDAIHGRFRDELGNVSDIFTDTIYPVSSPPNEAIKIYLPIILK